MEEGTKNGFDLLSKVPVFVAHQAFDPLFWMVELSSQPVFLESMEVTVESPDEQASKVEVTPAQEGPKTEPKPSRPVGETPARLSERRTGVLKSQVSPTLTASLAAQSAVQAVPYGLGTSGTGPEQSALSGEFSASIGFAIRRPAVSLSATHDGSSIQEVVDLPLSRGGPTLGRRAGPDAHESLFIGLAPRGSGRPADGPHSEMCVDKLEAPIKIFKPFINDHAYLLRQFLFGRQFNYPRSNRIVLFGLVDVGTDIFMTQDERPGLENPVRELLDRLCLFHADYEALRGQRVQ